MAAEYKRLGDFDVERMNKAKGATAGARPFPGRGGGWTFPPQRWKIPPTSQALFRGGRLRRVVHPAFYPQFPSRRSRATSSGSPVSLSVGGHCPTGSGRHPRVPKGRAAGIPPHRGQQVLVRPTPTSGRLLDQSCRTVLGPVLPIRDQTTLPATPGKPVRVSPGGRPVTWCNSA
jgi:hypothetical protein